MIMGPGELYFLPLGGTGEIGMNLNLYGYGGRWLMVDLGITFADERQPGVDVLMPDPAFIEERRESLAGLVLTHAHEDHLGAVHYLWRRLRCPIYATPFTSRWRHRHAKSRCRLHRHSRLCWAPVLPQDLQSGSKPRHANEISCR